MPALSCSIDKPADMARQTGLRLLALILLVLVAGIGYILYRKTSPAIRSARLVRWLRNPQAHSECVIEAGLRCGEAPFLSPTSDLVGYLWDGSFRLGHRHQGNDIFGGAGLNDFPVVAAYPGYLTRLPDWKSSLNNPTGIHLHFSIVMNDGARSFRNELEIAYTFDPSPYLGLNLNARSNRGEAPLCAPH